MLGNSFRHLNCIQIPQTDWPEIVVVWAPLERQKVEVDIFDGAKLSGFATWELAGISGKTAISTLFKALARPETNSLVYFLCENVYVRKICSVKSMGF